MLGTFSLASRPFAAGPRLPRAFRVAAVEGEYGYAAWSYSRQSKLNAWTWHGIGALLNATHWACLGNAVYMRNEADSHVYVKQPDVFYSEDDSNLESTSVEATTQWLDFGKPGKKKALDGIDADCKNVTAIEIYISENGGRSGTLATSIAIGDNDGGWTYNGEMIPTEDVGAATEFMLKFIGDGSLEVQVNRVTLHYTEVGG